ncbi:putative monovalent cation/H+ antiporter subunit E [Rubripirellula obstinata]|uniref:Putative monovalent cation/H+ antiporter subunit E n=1 Tax=Rubripirellula obstinata TaxID=406547 RepID=A0A5B1CIM8_9BACT|nr:Na+/H+ antiporter subunit E [Rubripirellula obstinata]KAA1259134.1 putative monovalent cation/H+ antiporter subunit E [Rubripirellula obstinata]
MQSRTLILKYVVTLGLLLLANWLLWSGHFESPFLIGLGVLSCLGCLFLGVRMQIIDEEGAPAQLGIRPFTHYAPWLIKEIAVSNWEVAKIVMSPRMPLKRNLILVNAKQQTPLGRVIYANSITLTPGTVSVEMLGDKVRVHALSLKEAADEMSSDMSDRVCRLEGSRPSSDESRKDV